MRKITAVLAFLVGLLPVLSAAQVPSTLPPNSVMGRLGIPTQGGPAQSIPFATLATQLGLGTGGNRTKIIANLTIYARSDGSDTLCNGLTNAALAAAPNCAFQTLQKSVDAVWDNYDGGGFTCTIQMAGTTPATFAGFTRYGSPVGCVPTISGDTGTPSNFLVTSTSPAVATIDVRRGFRMYIQGFKLQALTSGRGLHASSESVVITTGSMEYGVAVGGQLSAEHGSVIGLDTSVNYTISGGGAFHCRAIAESHCNLGGGGTVTLSGTPAFTTGFLVADYNGMVQSAQTYSGSATGPIYSALNGGVIVSTSTPPGNAAGVLGSLGLYNGWSGPAIFTNNVASDTPAAIAGTNLQVVGANATNNFLTFDAFGGAPAVLCRRADTSAQSKTAVQANEQLCAINSYGYGATGYSSAGRALIASSASENWTDAAQGTYWAFSTTPTGTATRAEAMRVQPSGGVSVGAAAIAADPGIGNANITGFIASKAPVTLTGTSGSVGAQDVDVIFNASGTFTATLPSASALAGRELTVKSIAAQTINSASSNVVPLAGGAAGTALLVSGAGKWARLKSDGTSWITMTGN